MGALWARSSPTRSAAYGSGANSSGSSPFPVRAPSTLLHLLPVLSEEQTVINIEIQQMKHKEEDMKKAKSIEKRNWNKTINLI